MIDQRITVLACIDGSTFSAAVVDYASWVAETVGAPLKLLHNIEHRPPPTTDLSGSIGLGAREALLEELTELESRRSKLLMEQGKVMLDEARQRAQGVRAVEVESLQRHGFLAESLVEMEHEIRVLVLGIRGEDHENRPSTIGAQLEVVIRAMHKPVLVVNRPFTEAPQRIMLAYDGSEASMKALNMVASSPLYHAMECHLVHVGKDADYATALLEAAGRVLAGVPGLRLVKSVLHGDVEQSLIQYQRDHAIQMTVMGAFGHGRLRELLFGSRTANILASSEVPLLLLR